MAGDLCASGTSRDDNSAGCLGSRDKPGTTAGVSTRSQRAPRTTNATPELVGQTRDDDPGTSVRPGPTRDDDRGPLRVRDEPGMTNRGLYAIPDARAGTTTTNAGGPRGKPAITTGPWRVRGRNNLFGSSYPGAGATIAQGLVFGQIIAEHAAQQA